MAKFNGWLFDLYEHPSKGVVIWLLGEDGKPRSFHQIFEVVFYTRGDFGRLHELGKFIRAKYSKETVRLERITSKEDLFDGSLEVMGIRVQNTRTLTKLHKEIQVDFSDIIFYDVDIPVTVRYAAVQNVFMMAYCEIEADEDGKLINIKAMDALDEINPKLPKLRLLSLRPNSDPSHKTPKYLIAKFGKSFLRLPFDKPNELLSILKGIFSSYDPDVVHTYFGDSWLIPRLIELSKATGIHLYLNRDLSMPVLRRKEVKFFNYGRAHYRAPQIHLHGRWHVDVENCMTYNQYRLVGAIEQVRLSSLPLQEVARRSPGAAISAMQTLTAMRRGILIPYQRQKAEITKTFNEYFKAARGGLILQPPLGIFQNVAVMDFSSKMASIMIKYNVSPETVVSIDDKGEGLDLPELGVKILSRPGLIPQTLQPMRDKRLALKKLLKASYKNDPQYLAIHQRLKAVEALQNYEAVLDALKWLTVVCYGRLRFANSIFGRINSHEVVSYLSRKAIIHAKRIVEERGGIVLHLYVDSLFALLPNASSEDYQALVAEIEEKTGLPMEMENVYAWFAFLASRQNPNVSVSNKFFGIAENGKHKIRGIALRCSDTCTFAANIQLQIIQILVKEKNCAKLVNLLPEVLRLVQERLTSLKNRVVPLEELVVRQTLSRDLNGYSVMSPPAIAARQLQVHGKTVGIGQVVRFIHTTSGPGAHAWDLPFPLTSQAIDVYKYKELILHAVYEILEPLGIREHTLRGWLFHQANYVTPADLVNTSKQLVIQDLPIFANSDYLQLNQT